MNETTISIDEAERLADDNMGADFSVEIKCEGCGEEDSFPHNCAYEPGTEWSGESECEKCGCSWAVVTRSTYKGTEIVF